MMVARLSQLACDAPPAPQRTTKLLAMLSLAKAILGALVAGLRPRASLKNLHQL
jgi:hypothetical protein